MRRLFQSLPPILVLIGRGSDYDSDNANSGNDAVWNNDKASAPAGA